MSTRQTIRLLAVLAAVLLIVGLAQAAPQDDDGMMAMEADTCAACHGELVESFGGPHAALDREGGPLAGSLSCSGCHGDPTAHLEAGGGAENIFSFDEENPFTVNAGRCQECHGDTHPQFFRSPHAKAGMSCQDCHSIHGGAEGSWAMLKSNQAVERTMDNLSAATLSCQECHGEVFTQFEFNERHRLQEGVLDCQSCHDPHGPSDRAQLGGFKQQACMECHQDKGGPFVFEHGSQRIEGCVACHQPHGSPNRHMLKFQKVGAVCYSCHVAVPGFHARFTLETNCADCHTSIHGSNFDRFFLK